MRNSFRNQRRYQYRATKSPRLRQILDGNTIMRIHHITSNYSMFMGGAERMVRELHVGLRNRNVESYILGSMRQKDAELEGARSMGFPGAYDVREFPEIYKYVTKNVRPGDILHAHQFPPILYVSLLGRVRQLGFHLVCTEHSTSNRRRGTFWGHTLDKMIYPRYDRIGTVSQGVEDALLNWMPELRGKTCVIFNGTRLHFERALHRPPKERLKVLSIGNLRPAKNYDNALKAMTLLRDLDFEYQIAGKGERLDEMERLCRELGLESKVRFLGYVEAIPELLASADIFLMPSRWEGFGLAAVEAMNASLPLVVSDVPGLREIVNGSPPCALLVDPGSPEAIAAGLRRLLENPELRLRFGKNAFEQAQKFSVDRMVESYISLYEQLV